MESPRLLAARNAPRSLVPPKNMNCPVQLAASLALGLTLPTLAFSQGSSSEAPEGLSASSWAEIQQIHQAKQHEIRTVEAGFEAINRGLGMRMSFDGRGLLVKPAKADWTWGLELDSYGFAGALHTVSTPATARATEGRMEYEWGTALQEWYINDARGLEHGFTLRERPAGDAGPLTFTLKVRGGLMPSVASNGRDVVFMNGDGERALRYSGLLVFDADGTEFDASFEAEEDRLLLSIDEEDAHYPLTIDPVIQQAYLKASNTQSGDWFGYSVAVSGDTVVVGAHKENGASTGVNGDQGNGEVWAGAAYVFVRNNGVWSQQAYVKPSNTDRTDYFGSAVAIDGDTMAISSIQEDSAATGVGGNQASEGALDSGAVYVFVRNGETWTQQAYIKASNTGNLDLFGKALALDGDDLAVGTPAEGSNATGINGAQGNNASANSGAVYLFRRTGTNWVQTDYIKASNADAGDGFGRSLAIENGTLVVGTPGEASNAAGINGDQTDDSITGSGAVYVFRRAGSSWSQTAYLKPSNPTPAGARFGGSVDLSGDRIVVGGYFEPSNATGVNGDESNQSLVWAGAAYVFQFDGISWSQEAYLKASNTYSYMLFGSSVGIDGDLIVVGAVGEEGSSPGVNGDQSDANLNYAGAAYVFRYENLAWSQVAYLKSSSPDSHDRFGDILSLSGTSVVFGCSNEQSAAVGVNGDWDDNSKVRAGAAYVFELEDPPTDGFAFCSGDGGGTACPCGNGAIDAGCPSSSTTGAVLAGHGQAAFASDSFSLNVSGLPPGKPGLCVKGSTTLGFFAGVVVGDGLLCTNPQLRSQVIVSNGNGNVNMLNWRGQTFGTYPNAANSPGTPTYYQWWYRDAQNTCTGQGFNFSNAWSVTWQ